MSDGDWIQSEHIHEKGDYRIIQTGNIGIGEFHDKPKFAKFINQSDFEELKANEVYPGNMLISRLAAPAGRAVIVPEVGNRMVTAVDLAIIRPDEINYNLTYLMTILNTDKILHEVEKEVSGTTHKRISRKNLEKIIIPVAQIDEQNQCADIFNNLQQLLTLHQ